MKQSQPAWSFFDENVPIGMYFNCPIEQNNSSDFQRMSRNCQLVSMRLAELGICVSDHFSSTFQLHCRDV